MVLEGEQFARPALLTRPRRYKGSRSRSMPATRVPAANRPRTIALPIACCADYDGHSLGVGDLGALQLTQGVLPRIEAGCPGRAKLAALVSVSPSSRRISMLPSTKFPP